MTPSEFYNQVCALSDSYEDRDLEPFLLALHNLLPKYNDKTPSFPLLIKIITEALTSEPLEFDEKWLDISEAPNGNRVLRKFTNPDLKPVTERHPVKDPVGLCFTYDVLHFQISELYKMRNKQLADSQRYFGVVSATGHDWYNFTAFSILECGIACMIDNKDDFYNMDWSVLGSLLEDGRIYE